MKTLLRLALLILLLASPAFASVDVASYATGGIGTQASPWTGWDTAITWSADTEYHFNKGWFAYSVSPNFLRPGIAIVGEAGTNLKHTGSGDAFIMDAGATPGSAWVQNVRVQNFVLWGNANTRNCFFLRGVRNGLFSHLSVKDVNNAAMWTEGCVTNILENFRCTNSEPTPSYGWSVRPQYGIVTTGRGGDFSTTWTIINPVIENVGTIGIWFKADSYGNTVINGTSEGNLGKGAVVEGGFNSFLNTDLEANNGSDLDVRGQNNSFINITSDQLVHFLAGQRHRVDGGKLHNLIIDFTVDQCVVTGVTLTGTLTDSALSTINFGNWHQATGFLRASKIGAVLPATLYPVIQSGILSTDAQAGDFFGVVVASNFTLANPINAADGQKLTWRFIVLPGSWAISYGNKFRGLNGILPALPAGVSWCYLTARWNVSQQTWDITEFTQ